MKRLIYTDMRKIVRELIQALYPSEQLVFSIDVDINPYHLCKVTDRVTIVGKHNNYIMPQLRSAMYAKEHYNPELSIEYLTNDISEVIPVDTWEDVACVLDIIKDKEERHDRDELEKDTITLLKQAPELERIPLTCLYDFLYTYVMDKAQAYDIEVCPTPLLVEKKSTWSDKDWNRKNGYDDEYSTCHIESRYRTSYKPTLADLIKAYLALQWYMKYWHEETIRYNQSSVRFITSYQKAKVKNPWEF